MSADALARDRVTAVIQGELRSLARQKTPFVLRTVYATLMAAGVAAAGAAALRLSRGWSGEAMAALGSGVFSSVVVVQATLAVVLGALLGVASMYGERHNKTLGLLALSQLRPREIVLGKLTALLGLVFSVLLAGVPVFALLGWAGGVDYVWLFWLAVYTLALAALGTATGLNFGLRLRSGAGAATASLAVLAAPVLLAPVAAGCGCLPLWIFTIIPLGIQIVATQSAVGDIGQGGVLFGVAMTLAATWVMVRLTVSALREAAAAGPGRGLRHVFEWLDRYFEDVNVGGIRFELGRSRSPRGNPVTWLTRTGAGMGLPHYSLRLLAGAVILSFIGLIFVNLGGVWSRTVQVLWVLAALGIPTAAGAGAFGDEKARKTLGVLLATPLTASTIVHGKLFVFLRLLLLLSLPAAFFLTMMKTVDPRAAQMLGTASLVLLAEAFLAYFLTLHLSLVLSSPLRAGVIGFAVLVALHVLFLVGQGSGANVLNVLMAADAILWNAASIALLLWIAAAGTAGVVASRRRRPDVGLVALLAALAPALGLVNSMRWWGSWHGWSYASIAVMASLIALAVFTYAYTVAFFDRTVGRSR